MSDKIRLQKYLAASGIASRRKAEEYILDSKVIVNGQVITELGFKINPAIDKIFFQGKLVKPKNEFVYIALNKPAGYVCTCRRFSGEKYILELLRGVRERVFPVGRLDKDSTGLIILTNDGDFAQKISHPSSKLEKEYIVDLLYPVTQEDIKKLGQGVMIDGQKTLPCKIKILSDHQVSIILKEGKNRQIKRMFYEVGNKVAGLKRVRIGRLGLGEIIEGAFKRFEVENI